MPHCFSIGELSYKRCLTAFRLVNYRIRDAYRLAQYSIQSIQLDLTLFLLFSSCATSIPVLCSQQDQGFALPALSHATERSLLIRSDTAKRKKMTHSGDGPSTYLGAVHSKRRTKKRLKKD
jgi:hypothetical protein